MATLKDQYENVDNTCKEKKTAFDKDERYLKNLQTEVAELEREIGLHNQNTQKERNLYLAQNKNHGEAEETLQVRSFWQDFKMANAKRFYRL